MTRDEFDEAVGDLRLEFLNAPERWENDTVERFLEALGAWVSDSPGYYANRGVPTPDVDWEPFITALRAAAIYE